MSAEQSKNVAELIDVDKWRDTLARFIDVLKINIFIVDFNGQPLSSPVKERFGWSFFEGCCLRSGRGIRPKNILSQFQKNGDYWENACICGLKSFAVPILIESKDPFAFLVVGPVALNKKESNAFYKDVAAKNKLNFDDLLDAVNEVRVVSHVTMKSILDLLFEVAKDVVELNFEKKRLHEVSGSQKCLSQELNKTAEDIYRTIHLDEILITLLDLAIKMTKTECGSIMVLDGEKEELLLKASRGIDESKLKEDFSLKLGQGIAGLAAQENASFVIHGSNGNKRLRGLLKRPEIKHSIVVPIAAQEKVLGVLNLHTKREMSDVDDGLNNLQYIKKLVAAAVQSI